MIIIAFNNIVKSTSKYFGLSYAAIMGLSGYEYINPKALFQSEYIHIILIFKIYPKIVKKILHLNLTLALYKNYRRILYLYDRL